MNNLKANPMSEHEKLIAELPEQVARIADPELWADHDRDPAFTPRSHPNIQGSLSRAQAIHALFATALEGAMGERDAARAGLAFVLDHAEYGNSYGVHGSDFTCCHFCQGGGAPGVAMEHEPNCPVSRYPTEVADWFDEMKAERVDREAAEARAERAEAAYVQAMEALRYAVGLLPGLAGAANQPDNAVYSVMATKGEILKARAALSVREEGEKGTYSTDIAAAGPSACAATPPHSQSEGEA